MQKRIISLALLAALLLLSLTACAQAAPPAEAPSPEPSPTPAPEPTPAVDPDTPEGRALAKGLPAPPDVDITSWEFILANSYNSIAEYEPDYGGLEGQGFDSRAVDAASAFLKGARDAGYMAFMAVAYRNYEYLLNHYIGMVAALGSAEETAKIMFGPGTSDHQTGLAIDFTDDYSLASNYNNFFNEGFEDTELFSWLCEHCAEYGFILRYPKGKEEYYGTACAGHFRYVGVDAATYIMENGLCLEEFILLYDPDAVYLPKK